MWDLHDKTQGLLKETVLAPGTEAGENAREFARDVQRKKIGPMLEQMSDDEVIKFASKRTPKPCPGPGNPQGRAEWLKIGRANLLEIMVDDMTKDFGMNKEPDKFPFDRAWYAHMGVFLLPAVLRKRHEHFDEIWTDVRNQKQSVKSHLKKAKAHVLSDWKPNPSLFDIVVERSIGYPNLGFDIFSVVSFLQYACERFGLLGSQARKQVDEDCPAFSIGETFFDGVVDGLKAMQGHIKLEVIHGDLMHELAKMRLNADYSRPTQFPRNYTRMWLSNVPDYTHGLLNTAVYSAHSLEDEVNATVAANCLLNTGSWRTGDDMCYNYTHLLKAEADLENILAVSHEALTFPVTFPVDFALSPDEISLYSVKSPRGLFKYTTAANLLNAFIPVMGLLFFKPGTQSADHLAVNVQNILEGKMGTNGTVQILTMVDTFDMWNGMIRWTMSKARVQKMREDGWVMAPYRCDSRESAVNQPFSARSWMEERAD
ncbi:hypothetical protein EUX98_g8146 [Antrodiella citrinella]|uniref:Uncharacterized protein n=1 Tax=Antrodiella citrinella TaxID=2447956 RepID=A0A4S4MB32_9APHY|nr:hypothetical protein EUX98_g8146 [Antrodiella citrinella]